MVLGTSGTGGGGGDCLLVFEPLDPDPFEMWPKSDFTFFMAESGGLKNDRSTRENCPSYRILFGAVRRGTEMLFGSQCRSDNFKFIILLSVRGVHI
jgi:hypothetical protein